MISSPGALCHVLTRGDGGQKVFHGGHQYRDFLSILAEIRIKLQVLRCNKLNPASSPQALLATNAEPAPVPLTRRAPYGTIVL